jgi:hypothetical protein
MNSRKGQAEFDRQNRTDITSQQNRKGRTGKAQLDRQD